MQENMHQIFMIIINWEPKKINLTEKSDYVPVFAEFKKLMVQPDIFENLNDYLKL